MQLKERRGNCFQKGANKTTMLKLWIHVVSEMFLICVDVEAFFSGCRLESVKGLGRRRRERKGGAASLQVKKKGFFYTDILLHLKLNMS